LLYRPDASDARLATWRLSTGHEALALFTTREQAETYRASLAEETAWQVFEPSRDILVEILQACRAMGILYAALDPLDGAAKTLFNIPEVLQAAK
jgi:predicted ATPase